MCPLTCVRFLDCRFFAANTCWIMDGDFKTAGHYKCPLCTRNYMPWKTTSAMMYANKLVVLDVRGNEKLASNFKCGKNDVLFFYVMWGDTAETKLQMRLKEIELNLDESLRDLSEDELYDKVISLIQANCQRSYFQLTQLTPWVVDEIKRVNSMCAKPWTYEHLQPAFYSAKAPEFDKETTKVMSSDDLLLMWGHFNFLIKAVTQKKK
jgi:hypothetical protein